MNEILTMILKDTYSLIQLKHRLNLLKNYLTEYYFATAKTDFIPKDSAWLKSLAPAFWQNFTKDNINDILIQLDKDIANLKILIVYLTFEPDDETLTQIGSYARRLFGNSIILDIKYDPNLIAGTALVWKGIYKNYSLYSKLEQNKELILQSFKKYLR